MCPGQCPACSEQMKKRWQASWFPVNPWLEAYWNLNEDTHTLFFFFARTMFSSVSSSQSPLIVIFFPQNFWLSKYRLWSFEGKKSLYFFFNKFLGIYELSMNLFSSPTLVFLPSFQTVISLYQINFLQKAMQRLQVGNHLVVKSHFL